MRRSRRTARRGLLLLGSVLAVACNEAAPEEGGHDAGVAPAVPASTPAPARRAEAGAAQETADEGDRIAATAIATTVYALPDTNARRLGYIRLGGRVRRDAEPVPGKGCDGDFYHVYPVGYVCTDEASIDMTLPLVRATTRRPDLGRPMPYHYGFVRATAPQYLRVPTREEQLDSEFKLEDHLAWYAENRVEVQRPDLGANDVPLDSRGVARLGQPLGADQVLSTQLSRSEMFGGTTDESIPWWLDGGRKIPNVSGFEVPDYAVFADRVRRKTGLSFVDAFLAKDGDFERQFAVTVDMRLIPTTKVKPDTGPIFHGVEIVDAMPMPFAFVSSRGSSTYKLIKGRDEAVEAEPVPYRALVLLTGRARIEDGRRFYQVKRNPKRWLQAKDIGIVAPPREWPEPATQGKKWIDISLVQQVLVLYEGKRPWYATLVSTGRDRLGDPKETLSTPQGEFEIRSKHIAAAMDSEENSNVSGGQKAERHLKLDAQARATVERIKAAVKGGKTLDSADERRWQNIQKGRHPEYGVTIRRGAGDYELRDVPWIQYFAAGYAIHGVYWHNVFGTPRSHGCVNLSPIDARVAFLWTDPAVPEGWHGINTGAELGEGTAVIVRE